MKRLAILLLLAGTAQAEYEVDPTCALFICMYDGHISYTDSTCLKARREMLERTAMSVVKFWERISPIEEYASCIYDGPTPTNGLASDPDAQIMVRSYSQLIEQEPDPAHPLRVTIEPGKCEAADRGNLPTVIKKGDCRATLRTYKGYLYGTQLGTILHVDEDKLIVYQEDTVTGISEIVIDPDPVVSAIAGTPAPEQPRVVEPVEVTDRPIDRPAVAQAPVQQASVRGDVQCGFNPIKDDKTYGSATVKDGVMTQVLTPASAGSNHSQGSFSFQNGASEYVVQQSIMFDADFDPVITGKAGWGIGGASTGEIATGGIDNPAAWSARPIWHKSDRDDTVKIGVYSYASNRSTQSSGGMRYGDELYAAELAKGHWYNTKMVVGMNSNGQANGTLQYYVDGNLVLDKSDIQWQAQGYAGDNVQGLLNLFHGGNGPQFSPDSPQKIHIKNVGYSTDAVDCSETSQEAPAEVYIASQQSPATMHDDGGKLGGDISDIDCKAAYDSIQSLTEAEYRKGGGIENWFTSFPIKSDDAYHILSTMIGTAQYYRATGDTSKLDHAIRIGDNYIASGQDYDNDGYKDWLYTQGTDFPDSAGPIFNYYHHELKTAGALGDVLTEMSRTGYKPDKIAEWRGFLSHQIFDKWAVGNNLTSNAPYAFLGDIDNTYNENVGRIALTAMALDKTDPNPGNNRYSAWLEKQFTSYFSTYINQQNSGTHISTARIDNKPGPGVAIDYLVDTSHLNDLVYASLRSKQLGYDFGGKVDEYFVALENHLDSTWFPDSRGFYPYSDGSGEQNQYHLAGAPGFALTASLSPDLRDRWNDYILNNKPTFTFYGETGNNWGQGIQMGASMMVALEGCI